MNYYEILGIEKSSSKDEIKKAYKKLALKYHPDRNLTNKDAEEQFKKISEAYSTLSDDSKKRVYDLTGQSNGSLPMDPFAMFSNIFNPQNLDSFVSDFFSNQSGTLNNFDDILGGPDAKISIHSFTQVPNFDNFQDIDFFDLIEKSKESFKKVRESYQTHRGQSNNLEKEIKELKFKNKSFEKQLYNKVDPLTVKMNITLDDFLKQKRKKIKIKRRRAQRDKKTNEINYINDIFQTEIKLNKKKFIFENEGHEDCNYFNPGDIVIDISLIDNNFKKLNDKIITFISITQEEYEKYLSDNNKIYIRLVPFKKVIFGVDISSGDHLFIFDTSEFTDNNFPKLIISCKIDNSKEKYTDKFFKLIKNEEVNKELYLKKIGESVAFEEIF